MKTILRNLLLEDNLCLVYVKKKVLKLTYIVLDMFLKIQITFFA